MLEYHGITVTSTAGYDKKANGRAERAVLWIQQKARTLLSSNIRSEKFQNKLKSLWTFAVQHAGEVHRREVFNEPRCKYEFGQVVLCRVNNPATKLEPKMQRVRCLGFAPNVTNGYFVMNKHDKIELTSNIADESNFDAYDELMEQKPGTSTDPPQPQPLHDYPYTERELEAIVGPEGGGGWFWADDSNGEVTSGSPDDPMEVISQVQLAKISVNLWQQEDIKPEEIPEGLQEEIR